MLLALHSDFILLIPSLRGSRCVGVGGAPAGAWGRGWEIKVFMEENVFPSGNPGWSAVQPDSGEIVGLGEPQLPGL